MPTKVNESLDHQSAARILNLPAPLANAEPARLVDLNNAIASLNAAIAGLNYIEQPARVVATANININSPGATIDGVNLANNDRVLLAAQTDNTQDGLWLWKGATAAMVRTGDTYEGGTVVVVGPDGAANKNTLWLQTTDNPVVGTTALTFYQFSSAISAGAGLQLIGAVLSLVTPVTVANGGTGATSAAAARTSLGVPGTYEQDFGDGSATSFAITHNLNKQYPTVAVYNKSTGQQEDCTVTTNSANQITLSAEAWTTTPPTANAYHVVVHG